MTLPDKCFILANPKGKSWDLANLINERLKNRKPSFEINPINIKTFRVGEDKPKIENNVREGWCFYIADSNENPSDWFTRIALINQALHISGAEKIINVLPHMFYSRQDRKDESRVPISARIVADIISDHADHVITLDVHAPQIQGFYDIPFDSLPSLGTVAGYLERHYPSLLEDDLVIVSPDAGGGKRAESFARILNNPNLAIGHKTRANGKKENKIEKMRFPEEVVKNKNVLMIDDLGDSYGTFCEGADALRELGARKIYGYTTHAFFTNGYNLVLKKLDTLFIGDTIKQPYRNQKIPKSAKNLITIPFGPLLSEAIYRTSVGASMSDLWDKKIFE
ncbi:MAG: ribose-phosphate diphosphokinase [Nanoarchaeota archaeon]